MADKNPGIEQGWSIDVSFDEKVRPMGMSSIPTEGYHQWAQTKADFHAGDATKSPRVAIHMDVAQTQVGVEPSIGMSQHFNFWLSFLDPNFDSRARSRGRTDKQIADEKKRDEAKFKSYFVSMGYTVEQIKGYKGKLTEEQFLAAPVVAFYERSWYDDDRSKWLGPYWTFVPSDKAAVALAGTLAKPKLYNEDRRKGIKGSQAVAGGATVTGTNLSAPTLQAPSLGAAPAALATPGNGAGIAPVGGIAPAVVPAQAGAVLGNLGVPQG